jgi:hypothetical protein
MVEPFCAGLSATSSACWMTFCNARMGFFRTTRCASKRGMPSGSFVAHSRRALTSLPQYPRACQSPRVRSRALRQRGVYGQHAPGDAQRVAKGVQHEGEHDGKDDRACQVERPKDLSAKMPPRKNVRDWMTAASPPRHPSPRQVAPASDRPGRISTRDAPAAARQQPNFPSEREHSASDDGLAERRDQALN